MTARAEAAVDIAPVYAGQAVEFVTAPQSAQEIIAELAGFRQVLAAASRRFG